MYVGHTSMSEPVAKPDRNGLVQTCHGMKGGLKSGSHVSNGGGGSRGWGGGRCGLGSGFNFLGWVGLLGSSSGEDGAGRLQAPG